MSFGGGSSGGGSTNNTTTISPYAPAEPALQQILSEAGTIYGQGPTAAGYVAPSTQTLQGLAAQETMANAANQQILNTIQGQYTNPFLSPLIANAATDVYSNVAGQFSGAGRTPTSPLAQSAVVSQLGKQALPLAFQQLERERNRQLQTARAVPSLTAVGGELENIQRAQQLGPQAALSQYYNTVAPIAYGLPTRSTMQNLPSPNALGMAGGGAMMGGSLANMLGMSTGWGAAIGGAAGLLGGLL